MVSVQCKRIQMTIVLPSHSPLEEWQSALLRRTSCWLFRLPQEMTTLQPSSKSTFIRLRRSKHVLGGLDINWQLIDQHLWTSGPSVLTRDELHRQHFLQRNSSTTDAVYKGRDQGEWDDWQQHRTLVVCFNPEDNHCVESQFGLFSCSVFCFSLAEFSLRED